MVLRKQIADATAFGRSLLGVMGAPIDSPAIDLGVYSVAVPHETYTYTTGRLTQVQLRAGSGGALLLQETYTYNGSGQITQVVTTDGTVTRTVTISYNGDGTIQAIAPV